MCARGVWSVHVHASVHAARRASLTCRSWATTSSSRCCARCHAVIASTTSSTRRCCSTTARVRLAPPHVTVTNDHLLPRNDTLVRYMLSSRVCPSVRPSVTSRSSTKIAKRRIMLTAPYNSPESLVFLCQRCPRNSTGVISYTGAPNAGGVGNNRRLSTNDSLYLGLLLLWPLLLTLLYVRLLRVCSISLNTQILKSGKRYKIDA